MESLPIFNYLVYTITMAIGILFITGIFTSVISAIAGMGGGVLLLSAMTLILPFHLIIPIHGVAQLVSNFTRSWYLRSNIRTDFLVPFIFGVPFGLFISFHLLKSITKPSYLYLVLALFILYVVFKPKKLPEIRLKKIGWFILGIGSGIQGSLLGATGPLIAPFYSRSDLRKEEIVSTKAAQQIVTHFSKIPLFLSLDFDYISQFPLILSLVIAAVIGTSVGVGFLKSIPESTFKNIFKFILLIAAIRLIYKAILDLGFI